MDKLLRLFEALRRLGINPNSLASYGNITPIKRPNVIVKDLDESKILEFYEAGKLSKLDIQEPFKDATRLAIDGKLNDAELLILTNNAERIANKLNIVPPAPGKTADIINMQSGQIFPKEKIETLIDELGIPSNVDPQSDLGRLLIAGKRLESIGKQYQTQKPTSIIQGAIDDFLKNEEIFRQSENTGYVRATVRQIMREDIQSGKLKLPKEIEDQVMQGLGEPIDIWRNVYGEDALEQIDSIVDELSKFRTEEQAAKLARSRFKFEPNVNRPPGSLTPEEMEQTLKDKSKTESTPEEGILSDLDEPEKKAYGGRVGFDSGGGKFKKARGIQNLIERLNKMLSKKKSMESMDPKTGELTIPKRPIRLAEEPKVKKYDQDMIKAANNIFPDYDDPKIAADQIAESYAEMKLKKNYNDLTPQEQNKIYSQAYDYVMDQKLVNDPTSFMMEEFKRVDPEGYANFLKATNRLEELSALRSGQEIFETYDLETYNYLTSEKILQLLNQLKNPYKILDNERDKIKMGFTNTNFEGVGLKNLNEINFRTDKKQLEAYLENLYNKKQIEEAQTELFNLQDSGRELNAYGGILTGLE